MKTLSLCLLVSSLAVGCSDPSYRTPLEEMERMKRPAPIDCARLDNVMDVCSDGTKEVYQCTRLVDKDSICVIYNAYRF